MNATQTTRISETSVSLTEKDMIEAVKMAAQRCPEYASTLSSLNEAHFAKRLYADAYAQLKAQYRDLAQEYMRLQQEHTEVHIKTAMIGDFLGYMSRRLEGPAESLEELGQRVSDILGAKDETLAQDLLTSITRLMHIISDLVQVAEAMRTTRPPVAPAVGRLDNGTPSAAGIKLARPAQFAAAN